MPGISTYVTEAWARTVDGSGAVTHVDEGVTGFVAVGTSGAVALLRTDWANGMGEQRGEQVRGHGLKT